MKKITEQVAFWIIYIFGVVFGFIFARLVHRGSIIVKNYNSISQVESGSIIACNHPSLLEPFLVVCLFLMKYVLHPIKFRPWITPDKRNFYDRWWFRFKTVSIAIDRTKPSMLALRKMLSILRERMGLLFIHIEGTRTFKAVSKGNAIYGKRGVLGEPRIQIGWLAVKSGAPIVPVWFDKTIEQIFPNTEKTERLLEKGGFPLFWYFLSGFLSAFFVLLLKKKQIVINIGVPFTISENTSPENAVHVIAEALLALADQ